MDVMCGSWSSIVEIQVVECTDVYDLDEEELEEWKFNTGLLWWTLLYVV